MDEITRKEYQHISDYKQKIAVKIRLTIQEFGENELKNAVLVGDFISWDYGKIAGFECIDVPTMSGVHLGRVRFAVARFFENLGE